MLNTPRVAIRPEDLAVEPVETEPHGIIEQAMFMGATVHYWIKVHGQTLRAVATGGSAAVLAAGQKVRLNPPPVLHLLRTYLPAVQGAR